MKYRVFKAKRFRKSLRKMLRRGKDINKINDVILKLANGETLEGANADQTTTVLLDYYVPR